MSGAVHPRRVVVLACGQPLGGDDAVGLLAVDGLAPREPGRVEVHQVGALELEHLTGLEADTRVVIVDALVGPEPGQVVDLDLADLADLAGRVERDARVVTASSHRLPLGQVVALAQLLRDEPLEGRFVGIGIGAVVPGAGPGAAVLAALPALRAAVERAISGDPA